jgi:manganese/zinc/iron transport system permease protein
MRLCVAKWMLLIVLAGPALGQERAAAGGAADTVAQRGMSWSSLGRLVTLRDYNTRVVILGVTSLGIASGLIGAFLLLRERALLGDAISHAMLPGIGGAFIVMAALGGTGKWLPGLLIGATLTGGLGVGLVVLITRATRIKQDAALGIVLSVLFGLGIAALGVIQNMGTGHAAGLEAFIYGKTASMLAVDAVRMAVIAGVIAAACVLLFKEFTLLSFDTGYAGAQGWPVLVLDLVMMALAVVVIVIGLQAVGLILVVALLVIPAAAARFWTDHLPTMLVTSAVLGGLSGLLGASASALVPRLPAGAVIVLAAGLLFALSMVFGPARGVLARVVAHASLGRTVARQHLLRALYELSESSAANNGGAVAGAPVAEAALLAHRAWTPAELRSQLRGAIRAGLVSAADRADAPVWSLTPRGFAEAWRVARNHRLWELYLITYADVAASRVDRDADEVEHVLEPPLIAELEALLARTYPDLSRPESPHALRADGSAPGEGPA